MHRATRFMSSLRRVTPLSTTGRSSTASDQDPHAATDCATVSTCDGTRDEIPARQEPSTPSPASADASPDRQAPGAPGPGPGPTANRDAGRAPFPLPGSGPRPGPASGRARRFHRHRADSRTDTGRAASSPPTQRVSSWPRPRLRSSHSSPRRSRTLLPLRPWARWQDLRWHEGWSAGRGTGWGSWRVGRWRGQIGWRLGLRGGLRGGLRVWNAARLQGVPRMWGRWSVPCHRPRAGPGRWEEQGA